MNEHYKQSETLQCQLQLKEVATSGSGSNMVEINLSKPYEKNNNHKFN